MSKKFIDNDENNEQPIENLISNTIKQIKALVDSDIVVGKEIVSNTGKKILPISRVSVGFVAGGGEYTEKQDKVRYPYAGGSGAGFSVIPMGLIVINGGEVEYIKITQSEPLIKLIDCIPDAINALTKKHKEKKDE